MTSKHPLKSAPSQGFRVLSLTEPAHHEALQPVLDSIRRMNDCISAATEAGISIELIRMSRMHNGQGHWGDQIALAIRQPDSPEI